MVKAIGLALGLGAFLLVGSVGTSYAACQDGKLKATGKKAFKILKAHSKNIKKPNPGKLASAISKAQSRFTKSCDKAVGQGNCPVAGNDCAALEAKVDAYVDDVFSELASPSGAFIDTTTGALD